MGIGKSIKKTVKKAFKIANKITGLDWLHKTAKKGIGSLFGVGAMKDMAASQEAQLRQQTEAAKLDSMNEMGNVTQFSDNTAQVADFGDDNTERRKKRSAGAFSSGIGLQV